MKHTLLALAALVFCTQYTAAQTIIIDGDASEWNTLPMITEPGTFPMAKVAVPQNGVNPGSDIAMAYMVMQENNYEADLNTKSWVAYIDTDSNPATGTDFKAWGILGYEYEPNTWDNPSALKDNVMECAIKTVNVADIIFPCNAIFGYNWCTDGTLPISPEELSWQWSQTAYNGFNIKPFVIKSLQGTHTVEDAYSRNQFLGYGHTADFNVSGGGQDIAMWLSWTIQLTQPNKYIVSADVTSSNTASVDLYLVDLGSNQVVATFTSNDIWAPNGTETYGEWDLSTVPAGNYMLKMKNHVQWSQMILTSVTLQSASVPSAIQTITDTNTPTLIFDIMGRQVNQMTTPGTYILHTNNAVKKVVIP